MGKSHPLNDQRRNCITSTSKKKPLLTADGVEVKIGATYYQPWAQQGVVLECECSSASDKRARFKRGGPDRIYVGSGPQNRLADIYTTETAALRGCLDIVRAERDGIIEKLTDVDERVRRLLDELIGGVTP